MAMDERHRQVLAAVDAAPEDWPGAPASWFGARWWPVVGQLIAAGVLEAVDASDPLPRRYPPTNPGRVRTYVRRR